MLLAARNERRAAVLQVEHVDALERLHAHPGRRRRRFTRERVLGLVLVTVLEPRILRPHRRNAPHLPQLARPIVRKKNIKKREKYIYKEKHCH